MSRFIRVLVVAMTALLVGLGTVAIAKKSQSSEGDSTVPVLTPKVVDCPKDSGAKTCLDIDAPDDLDLNSVEGNEALWAVVCDKSNPGYVEVRVCQPGGGDRALDTMQHDPDYYSGDDK